MLLSLLLSVQVEAQAVLSPISVSISAGVSIHWTGLLEWTTGLDYWTHPNYLLSVKQKLNMFIQPVTLLMFVP